jgi:hypothetical protein
MAERSGHKGQGQQEHERQQDFHLSPCSGQASSLWHFGEVICPALLPIFFVKNSTRGLAKRPSLSYSKHSKPDFSVQMQGYAV